MTDFKKIIDVLGVIAAIGNVTFGIADHNFSAVAGWSVATLYMGKATVDAFLS